MSPKRAGRTLWAGPGVGIALLGTACAGPVAQPRDGGSSRAGNASADERLLFDGSSLAGFERTNFGGEGEVRVEDGHLLLGLGSPLTGVHWIGEELPREDFELELAATRVAGTDFFCGLTFPVGTGHASLILGGWGGATCGLSCIDGLDASENETTTYRRFETGREVRIRVRVDADRVRAWVDSEKICDVVRASKRFEVRAEVLASRPFGICAFATEASVAPVRLRTPAPPEEER